MNLKKFHQIRVSTLNGNLSKYMQVHDIQHILLSLKTRSMDHKCIGDTTCMASF